MNKNISCLITGCPRSGTTILGEILSTDMSTSYLYEPTNFLSGDRAIKNYFPIPGSEGFSYETAVDYLERVRLLDLDLKPGLWGDEHGIRLLLKTLIGGRSRVSLKISRVNPFVKRIIWKDPFAFFLIPTLMKYSAMPVIITERRIEQVCASFKRLSWKFDCRAILEEINHPSMPASICTEIDLNDTVNNGAVLWNIINRHSRIFAADKNVIIIDLEKLIDDPVETCSLIFQHCNIDFNDRIMEKIRTKLPKPNGVETPLGNKAHQKGRSRAGITHFWQKSLTEADLASIHAVNDLFRKNEDEKGF